MKKGLRLSLSMTLLPSCSGPALRPDEEGIKTPIEPLTFKLMESGLET